MSPAAASASGAPASPPQHQLLLGTGTQQQTVAYQLRRSLRARRINLRIGLQGLVVTLPQHARLGQPDIEQAIRAHSQWILQRLPHWQQRASALQASRPRYADGGRLPLLGRQLTLRLQPHAAGQRTRILQLGEELWISGPASQDPARLAQRLEQWLKQQARAIFAQRLPLFSQRLGRAPRAWSLSSARTRWGSCSQRGDIRLNWRLVQFEPELIDYVIAHELAHLVEMNHSPRFWSQLEQLLPGSRALQKRLAAQPDVLLGR